MNNSSPNSPPRFPPITLIVLAVLLWSTGGLFIKWTTLDAFSVNAGRSLLAALTVAVFTYKKGLKLNKFTLLTAFLYAGTLSCFVYANKTTTAANAIFLQYTAPIYILILSPFILKERFRLFDLVTVVLCLAGMSLFFLEPQNSANKLAARRFYGQYRRTCFGCFLRLVFYFSQTSALIGEYESGDFGFLRQHSRRAVDAAVGFTKSAAAFGQRFFGDIFSRRFPNRHLLRSIHQRHRRRRSFARCQRHRIHRAVAKSRLGFPLSKRTPRLLVNRRRRSHSFRRDNSHP